MVILTIDITPKVVQIRASSALIAYRTDWGEICLVIFLAVYLTLMLVETILHRDWIAAVCTTKAAWVPRGAQRT